MILSHVEKSHVRVNCYSKDNNGIYLFCNQDTLDFVHVDALIGKKDEDLFEQAVCSQLWAENEKRIMNKKANEVLYEPAMWNGKVQWFRSLKSPISGHSGKVIGVTGVSVPIQAKTMIPITKQQTACLKHLALGMTVRQIGDALGLSPKTVEHYLEAVKLKLHCESRSELILQAIERGLVNAF